MKDYANPIPNLPYLAQVSADTIDQLHDRIQSELQHHQSNARGVSQNIELSPEEAIIAVGNLERISHLLRKVSEGTI